MQALLMELLPLVKQGYCCSQLLAHLLLQARGEERPDLIRATQGLCHGIGQSGGPCGLLTGGAVVLSYLAGKGAPEEEAHPMFEALLNDYATWFYGRCAAFGGPGCEEVVAGLGKEAGQAVTGGKPDLSLCGQLLAECWDKILETAEAYDVDVAG